ncbi:MAG: hypothetical protein KGJ17_07995, partial [Gammaproteobacteria bacterium]|nr:hypothetical protein [Gammaproteobacteria bacterium]
VSGGSPYGASTIAGADGTRQPTRNELNIARAQGEHVARIAAKLAADVPETAVERKVAAG